jgi:hypothetical protein
VGKTSYQLLMFAVQAGKEHGIEIGHIDEGDSMSGIEFVGLLGGNDS